MRPISSDGFESPPAPCAGAAPRLEWLRIIDLVVDPSYHRPITKSGNSEINRIARSFSWSCFAPVVVAALDGGKYAVIDGKHRTTAALVAGFDVVPCQIVVAAHAEQAAAAKAINRVAVPFSRMAMYAGALTGNEPFALQLADVCARSGVEPLRYPVPIERQSPGQTMAIGALAQCLKRYGEETLITALQCITQTANNVPGALSARTIKALCRALDSDRKRRDSGLALFDALDAIDIASLAKAAAAKAAATKVAPVQALSESIHAALVQLLPIEAIANRVKSSGAKASYEGDGKFATGRHEKPAPLQIGAVMATLARTKDPGPRLPLMSKQPKPLRRSRQ
jgi:ParB-like nuclease domain